MSRLNSKNRSLLIDLFVFLSGAIILMVVFELLWPNSVLVYFNLNYAVLAWLFLGLTILFL